MTQSDLHKAAAPKVRRLFVYSIGLLWQRRVREILRAAGWSVEFGWPSNGDAIGVWGRKSTAKRGARVARWRNAPLYTIEDAFLRSVQTGRQLAPTLGIVVDKTGIYFDTSNPSDMQHLLGHAAELSGNSLDQASRELQRMLRWGLSKYNAHEPLVGLPSKYVLVIDQTKNDASILKGGANEDSFARMLRAAKIENPDLPIVVKTHPETQAGKREGHFGLSDEDEQVHIYLGGAAPQKLFEHATSVYCVTSQMGMEAIFSGHRPHVFGQPFYSGRGLTHDRVIGPVQKSLTVEQLFWAAYTAYPIWYDPFRGHITSLSRVMQILQAQARAWRQDVVPTVFIGMRLWKRGFLRAYFAGAHNKVRFTQNSVQAVQHAHTMGARCVVWARECDETLEHACEDSGVSLFRMEDGFLRSAGLGAELVPPSSLVLDDIGIYYDATRPSRLEALIEAATLLAKDDLQRAEDVRRRVVALNLSKYNLATTSADLELPKDKEIILVPGQVEDDASILKGTDGISDNMSLLRRVRADFPSGHILYKPHPDVEAGLRVGEVNAEGIAGQVLTQVAIADILHRVDRVCTMTSLTGFEALLRGKAVTCYGMPFYAGWGLTDDRGAACPRRQATPTLDALVHACLIDYPRYFDPVTREACPVEVILDRFEDGRFTTNSNRRLKLLAKLQGIFASYAWSWR